MQPWNAPKQIVSRDDELERELGVHFLIAHGHVFDRRDDGQKLFFGFAKLLMRFYDLLERHDLLFRLSRLVESLEQFVRLLHTLAAHLNGIVLFRWKGKNPTCLKRFLR